MQKQILTLLLIASVQTLFAQNNLYFPPKIGTTWSTIPPADLGFCPHRIDSLYHFLEQANTKSFILLQDGKIVLEKYFGTYTKDSIHYWASAGKSMTAFLVGQAQDEGLLSIEDKTSDYLGTGWTSLAPDKEEQITIRHQLTMTTGLNDAVPDQDCLMPECLIFKADAGTRWAYHNAPYRLLQDVVAESSGLTFQQFTKTRLLEKTGMFGLWINYIQYGRARDMARFGLLMLADGIWNGDTLLHNPDYLEAMRTPSQTYNKSYGYLWWLNGQPSYMMPTTQFIFTGPLCPNAPPDMYAALGKGDQKIHIVPGKNWVIVRQGESNGTSQVPVVFDNAMWGYINALECSSGTTTLSESVDLMVTPTVSAEGWNVYCNMPVSGWQLYNSMGQILVEKTGIAEQAFYIREESLLPGAYFLKIQLANGVTRSVPVVKY